VNANQFIGNTQPNSEGVIYWESASPFLQYATPLNGLLAPSRVGNVVTIANGVGMVQGWVFTNTDDVDFDFSADPGNASATDLIVLERGDPAAAQTVRLARVKGAASTLATVTQTATVWQIALAQVPLSAGGLPTGLTDVRRFANQVMSWRQGGSSVDWSSVGTSNYLVGNVEFMSGARLATILAGTSSVSISVTFPKPFTIPPHFQASIQFFDTGTILLPQKPFFLLTSVNQNLAGLTIYTGDLTNVAANTIVVIHWIAIGQRA
jgi:hypothetical protein